MQKHAHPSRPTPSRHAVVAARALFAVSLGIGAMLLAAQQKSVSAAGGWVKLPAASETATAAFVVVENPTMYDVYLVSATTDAAGEVQFRDAGKTTGGAPAVVKEITAPAYDRVELTPAGLHLWLTQLKRPLKAGDTVAISLTTDGGVKLEVTAEVRP